MLVIWLGALLVLGGLLFMLAQPIWRGRLSEARRRRPSAVPSDTLEPRSPGAGFGLKENWPGLVFMVLGGILLLVGAFSLPSAPIEPIAPPTPHWGIRPEAPPAAREQQAATRLRRRRALQ